MALGVHPDDPAFALWQRVEETDLSKFTDLMTAPPVKVGLIAERLGIEVVSLTLSVDISGLIRRRPDESYEIQVNNTDAPVRQRFTVCHEIAHYLLHRTYIDGEGITDNILYRSKLSNRQEAEANRLGAAILLPWPSMLSWHLEHFNTLPRKENIDKIADAFKASSLSVGFRLGV